MKKSDQTRKKLIELGAENLADHFLRLAKHSPEVAEAIERTITPPSKSLLDFKKKLRSMTKGKRFFSARESRYVAGDLTNLLEEVKRGATSAEVGVDCLIEFYKSDNLIFERCDDSNGWIGDVYRFIAVDIFVEFAQKYSNKDALVDMLADLFAEDDYGIRIHLIKNAKIFLPKPEMRTLANRFWDRALLEVNDSFEKRHWLYGVCSLAEQLQDAGLYEKACRQMRPELSSSTHKDIAQVYLACDDPETALVWMNRIDSTEQFQIDEREKLLLDIYRKLGKLDEEERLLWSLFCRNRSLSSLNALLEFIGKEQREQVLREEYEYIINAPFSTAEAQFLLDTQQIEAADTYILTNYEQLDGRFYTYLLPLTEGMEKHKKYLSASMIYRALIESILQRVQSKYYHHAVRYLRKLEVLAPKIQDWAQAQPHGEYFEEIKENHRLKKSLWRKYNE
ncbi:MAG: DUF6880 family protein [Calditrichota bacterium]